MASEPPFRIVASEVVRRQLRSCARMAKRCHQHSDFKKWIEVIYESLESDPTSFGDPLAHSSHMTMMEYQAMRGPIRVVYTVHDSLPIVFLKMASYFPEYGARDS